MSRTAVVILNYNGQELLQKFLPSVIRYTEDARVIVADNHSTDGSVNFVRSAFPTVEIIEIPENYGFAGGYNFALRQVEAEYYVLLNSDVEVTEGWLSPLIALLDGDPQVGAVQPKILAYNNKAMFEYAGAAGGFIDWLGYPFCRGRLFADLEEDHHQYDDTIPVFWATGACMAVRSTLYHTLHGLDEDFFAHMEEIDFCWQLHRAGKKVMACGQSKVYHVGGATLSQSNPRKTYYNFRNSLQMLFKNLAITQLCLRLPIRILLDWVAAAKFLLSGQLRDAFAVIRAHFYILFRFPGLLSKRDQVVKASNPAIYGGSIVFDYYIKGRKKFTDLKF